MTLQLDLQVASEADGVPDSTDFSRWAAAALEGRGPSRGAELAIRVVDEAEGRTLNRDYRDRDYATNVLSFRAELPEDLGLQLLGDLVICAPVVAREAAEQGKPELAHWAHLTVHGCLHLLGFDHEADAEAEIMEALETQIMGRLGYPDPYQENHANA
ncbi:MAG TPA: rRNA maturation RNase YbeY [Gammaproteobacteria bacterium]